MKSKILGIMFFAAALLMSHFALANFACDGGVKKMVESLNLDESQKEKIKPILEQLSATAKEKGQQMKEISDQIKQQVRSGNMDQDTVNNLVDKKTQLIGDMMKAKINAKAQIFNILNDKQKAELTSKMQQVENKIADKFKKCDD